MTRVCRPPKLSDKKTIRKPIYPNNNQCDHFILIVVNCDDLFTESTIYYTRFFENRE